VIATEAGGWENSDIRTSLDIYAQIRDPESVRVVNQVTNRTRGSDEEG
jgi:hypothetical protein